MMLTVLPKSAKFRESGKRETQTRKSISKQRGKLPQKVVYLAKRGVERYRFPDVSRRNSEI